mmetsp:Transcript_23171/g.45749  ORF Transcript_23171/g.45749 Transcript_23171/m.45749 type:complete len:201 (-) Transcript_23171:425-1027(-)
MFCRSLSVSVLCSAPVATQAARKSASRLTTSLLLAVNKKPSVSTSLTEHTHSTMLTRRMAGKVLISLVVSPTSALLSISHDRDTIKGATSVTSGENCSSSLRLRTDNALSLASSQTRSNDLSQAVDFAAGISGEADASGFGSLRETSREGLVTGMSRTALSRQKLFLSSAKGCCFRGSRYPDLLNSCKNVTASRRDTGDT